MITLYYNVSNDKCRKALKWFEEHNIEICKKRVSELSREHLIVCLSLSDRGFDSILKHRNKTRPESLDQINRLEKMMFKRGVDFILNHTSLLKTPIIIDENKLLIGYNEADIRMFISKDYRHIKTT